MNNLLKLVILIMGSQLLLSCTGHKPALLPSSLQKQQWQCDSGAIVDWVFEDSAAKKIQLRLDGGQKLYILDKVYATDKGVLYSNGELAFRLKGKTGLVFWANNDEVIGDNCTSN